MSFIIFDIETNGLDPTRIYCLSYDINGDKKTITEYQAIIDFLNDHKEDTLVGHNIILYDIPVLEKLLGIEIKNEVIDTLALSWYLYPYLDKHNLESWGESFALEKVKILDWVGLSLEEYIERCERDVEITQILFVKEYKYLNAIYSSLETAAKVSDILSYLSFKMYCLLDHQKYGIKLDTYETRKLFYELDFKYNEKVLALEEAMPKVVEKTRPKIFKKKNGDLSELGKEWVLLLERRGLPEDTEIIYKKGNPGSPVQIKNWLFSLGWKPKTFNISKQTGLKVPQISLEEGQICPSVKRLFEDNPVLEVLEGLSIFKHRRDIVKGFLEKENNGYLIAVAHGFTNTLRFAHAKPLVNLPKPSLFMGEKIRSLLICEKDELLCGIDISGLEATTADHYMYFFDPDYVKQRQEKGFDPHLNLGIMAGLITQEESDFYKEVKNKLKDKIFVSDEDKKRFKKIDDKRFKSKTVNFSSIYGAGPPKIAEAADIPLTDAKNLHTAFWLINKAIKEVSNNVTIKTVFNTKWLFNPVSRFFYYVKAEKDVFSTLNQGTGVYVFDLFLRLLKQEAGDRGLFIFQYHDETLGRIKTDQEDMMRKAAEDAVRKLNNILRLNTQIKVDIKFGKNYSEVH